MCATILYHNKLQQMCLTKGSSMTELQELRRYRRDLHRIPELDFDLPQTIAYIEGVLAPLTCEVTHPCPGDSRRYGCAAHRGSDGSGLCLNPSRQDARLRT